MTLQLSGAISFTDIQTIFGGTNPIGMNEYYTNDASGFTTGVSGLPSTGSAISLQQFYGKAKSGNGLYTFSTHTFTNAGATGFSGPIISQVRSAYSGAAWAQNNSYLSMTTQGIQEWTVPATGSYTIRVAGAKGGGAKEYTGGSGRTVDATFTLTQNQVIKILIGQSGLSATSSTGNVGGGGGGGSFVINKTDNSILLIAGGGGGAKDNTSGYSRYSNGVTAPYTNAGTLPSGGTGSTSGNGGGAYQGNWSGGGGGGFSGNGGLSPYGSSVGTDGSFQSIVAGISFTNGGLGGKGWTGNGYTNTAGTAHGGFGGGGGCVNDGPFYPGGGGGYSGGDGTDYSTNVGGGGGGYYSNGTNTTDIGTNASNGYVTITPNFTITPGVLYTFSTHTFTNAGATGRTGPIISQVRSAYSTASWAQNSTYLNMTTQGIQEWTVPATGSYTITCNGARGRESANYSYYGFGASMTGTFSLTIGEIIKIIVGQIGTVNNSGAGGGGTGVIRNNNSILVIAGGGGGAGHTTGSRGHGLTTDTGGAGATSTGAVSGNGGAKGYTANDGGWSGGGGGFSTNGYGGDSTWDGGNPGTRGGPGGGLSFLNGGIGSTGGGCCYTPAEGGFGCGGGGGGALGGGGGGGYSGGSGSQYSGLGATGPYGSFGGGGGSLNNGSNQTNTSGANDGVGSVTITKV